MSMFALLWGKILRSSIWVRESKATRLVWITLLALKDEDGTVRSSVIGLADQAKVTLDECKEALRILSSPDPDDSSKVEEGRRIKEVPGGWFIINHELYRFSAAVRRVQWKAQKAAQRERSRAKGNRGKPVAGESIHMRGIEAGIIDPESGDWVANPKKKSASS